MMERRPALLVLLLAFSLFGLVALREARFHREVRKHSQALAESLQQHRAGSKLSADDLGRLAEPMGFIEASYSDGGRQTQWRREKRGLWDRWPAYKVEQALGPARQLRVAMPAEHWGWHLAWSLLLIGLAGGLSRLQSAWEAERRQQRERLDKAASSEAGALQRLQGRLEL